MSEQPSGDVRGWTNVSSEKVKPERDGVGSHCIELFVKILELTERALRIKKEDQEHCCHMEGVGRGEGPGRPLGGSAGREGQSPS